MIHIVNCCLEYSLWSLSTLACFYMSILGLLQHNRVSLFCNSVGFTMSGETGVTLVHMYIARSVDLDTLCISTFVDFPFCL